MRTIKGPAVFLAQFARDEPPFNSLDGIAAWAATKGFKGIQIPTADKRLFDVEKAAQSQAYCDEVQAICARHGVEITELATHIHGQLIAVHPAHDMQMEAFADLSVRGNSGQRLQWAEQQLKNAARASNRLGLDRVVTCSGSLLWPYFYPQPTWPDNLIGEAFAELARRWRPILDVYDENGVDLCYELHPMQDLHDGVTFERFLDCVDGHNRCNIMYDPSHFVLQYMDYLAFIDHYHERIRTFHVKDAELRLNGKTGVYGGYLPWIKRAGRFRSLGDGQIDFRAVFSKMAAYDFDGWAVLEWECCLKNSEDGAREGAKFIADHIIAVADRAFDDFVKSLPDPLLNQEMLGLNRR